MIQVGTENIFPLAETYRHVPLLRGGKRLHPSTAFRWARTGVRGVKLETIQGAITGSCGWRFEEGGVPLVNRKTTNRPKWSRSTPPWISLLPFRSPGQRPAPATS